MPTTVTVLLMLLTAWFAGARGPAETVAPEPAPAPEPALVHEHIAEHDHAHEQAHIYHATFRVPRLSPPLANRLRVSLGGFKGILGASPDLEAGTIVVTYAPELLHPQKMLAALQRIAPDTELSSNDPAPEIKLPGHKCGNPLHRH